MLTPGMLVKVLVNDKCLREKLYLFLKRNEAEKLVILCFPVTSVGTSLNGYTMFEHGWVGVEKVI